MKPTFLVFALGLTAGRAFAQNIDSLTTARQVDSLLDAAHRLTSKRSLDKAGEALAAAEHLISKSLGKDPNGHAKLCSSRGYWLSGKRDFPAAEASFKKALALQEALVGRQHPDFADVLHHMAVMYFEMGEMAEAETLELEAIPIFESGGSATADKLANSMQTLGHAYTQLRNHAKAEPAYRRAVELRKAASGGVGVDYTVAMMSLANCYRNLGRLEQAEPIFLDAIGLLKTMPGEQVKEGACHYNLALAYQTMHDWERAVAQLGEAKTLWVAALGPDHPYSIRCAYSLGGIHTVQKRYDLAEPLFAEVAASQKRVIGTENPDYLSSIYDYAFCASANRKFELAAGLFVEAAPLMRGLIAKSSLRLSEEEVNKQISFFTLLHDEMLSSALIASQDLRCPVAARDAMAGLCLDNALFFKSNLLNSALQFRNLAGRDTTARRKLERLQALETQLAAHYARAPAKRDSAVVADLQNRSEAGQRELARQFGAFAGGIRPVGWRELRQGLWPGEAAVEFERFSFYDDKQKDSVLYAALVVTGDGERAAIVPLFEEKQLENLLSSFKNRRAEYANQLYSPDSTALYDLLWRPIEAQLSGVKTVYFSPAGLLHRINLAAVPVDENTRLGNRHHLVQLGSTRSLALPEEEKPANRDALLVGGVDYEGDGRPPVPTETGSGRRGELDFNMTDSTLRGGAWKFLANTAKEVADAADILAKEGFFPTSLTGGAATETVVKQLGINGLSPRVLHFATHGYFFPDPKSGSASAASEQPAFKISDHPMIRSGLILAGANYAWRGGRVPEGADDGILTAYEISQLNLSNTELVILSACETGLGDIRGNEGVFGLQRAFKIAGAKHIVMSLWQVPDRATQELMSAFYQKWLGGRMELRAAFRAAQDEVRAKWPEPFYWAGFVLLE